MKKQFPKKLVFSAIFSLLLIVSMNAFGQVNLDSLWGVWNDENAPDSSRAYALFKYSWDGYLFSQPDSGFYFGQILFDFANQNNLKKDMARAKRMQGVSYYVRSEYTKAIDNFQSSLTICEEISDKNGMVGSMINIGVIYSKQGYYPKAIYYYQRVMKILEEISDKTGMAYVLNNIGIIYKNKGQYTKAMEHYKRAFSIQEELSDLRGMANALDNIALIYKQLADYPKAMEYHERSLGIREDLKDKRGIANTLINIGECYKKQGKYPEALDYFQQSLIVREEISDEGGIAAALNNIGQTHIQLGNYMQAINWCKNGLETAEDVNILDLQRDACQCLYDAYKSVGDHSNALEYHERITLFNDSLQEEETVKELQKMEFAKQILADSLQQEEKKLRVQMENEEEVRKKNRTRNIYLLLTLFLLIFAIGLRRRMLYVRKTKRAIEKEKDRSENLLLNILPKEIADELKEKGRAEARNFNSVSVLFTDFKGFTRISEQLSAEELVQEINVCFKAFDTICGKYGIEKIKTIGDAFMAAGGLPVPSDDSVKNTVLAAIEMMEFMVNKKNNQESEGKICFEMRAGIHTGPVVAGIVGVTKFQYDIWGDSVNIASIMENSGEVGRVNISRSTYDYIKDDSRFKFQSRGKIQTKGKEALDMWFVERAQ